jgi:ankyrin repeat protein
MLAHATSTRPEGYVKTKLNECARIDGFNPLLAAVEASAMEEAAKGAASAVSASGSGDSGRTECIRVCVRYGADVAFRVLESNPVVPGGQAVHVAAHYGGVRALQILSESGADVTTRTSALGSNPLHIAIQHHHASVVRFLLTRTTVEERARLRANDTDGRLPSYYAHQDGNESILEEFFTEKLTALLEQLVTAPGADAATTARCASVLTQYGASLGVVDLIDTVEAHTGVFQTPLLTQALLHHKHDMVRALVGGGASWQATDSFGLTPLFWATLQQNAARPMDAALLNPADLARTHEQLGRIAAISGQSLQDRMLMNFTSANDAVAAATLALPEVDIQKRMQNGFSLGGSNKAHTSACLELAKRGKDAEAPSLLGWLDKVRSSKALFADGKQALDRLLWEAKVHTVRLLASGQETQLTPAHLVALYAFTSHATVTTQVNNTLEQWNKPTSAIWRPFVECLYQAMMMLPEFEGEHFRGVDAAFDPDLYAVGAAVK